MIELEQGDHEIPIPPIPPAELFPVAEIQQARAERAAAIQARRDSASQRASELTGWLAAQGATVVGVGEHTGTVRTQIPADLVQETATRPGVATIHPYTEAANNCDSSCTMAGSSRWRMGEGRADDRLDLERFRLNGYTGEISNASRHSYNDITVAVIEVANQGQTKGYLEDEACLFGDFGNQCTPTSPRIKDLYDCTNSSCPSTGNFSDTDANSAHGTIVTSIILADLDGGQADNFEYNDSCWDGISHCEDWQEASTGMAPEAGLLYYSAPNGVQDAYEDVLYTNPDIVNLSHSSLDTDCDITSSAPSEDVLETAFDDGAFVVTSSGNGGLPAGCSLEPPGDTPKVFVVNSFAADAAGCRTNFQSCSLDAGASERGGMDATINGTPMSGIISGVDLVAPNDIAFRGTSAGYRVEVVEDSTISGSSVAAPHVSGAAAALKDWALSNSQTWINSPGRLHTMMLAMGDRWNGSSQSLSGVSDVWGMGRMRMRLFDEGENLDPYSWRIVTWTVGPSSGDKNIMLWSSPMAWGTDLLKCVLMEDEDMSSKSDVGDIWMRMRVRDPMFGVCSTSGAVQATRTDASYDIKHMVAFEDTETNLDAKCAELEVNVAHVAQGEQIHAFCYTAGEVEDE